MWNVECGREASSFAGGSRASSFHRSFALEFRPHRVIQCITHLQEAPMLAIRLEKELEERIAELAIARGGNKSTVVREAVLRYLEDHEDVALARRARKGGGRGKSLAE